MIKAADKAISDKDKEVKLSDLALQESKAANDALTKQVVEKDDKLNSPLRNPFLLIGVGLLISANFVVGGTLVVGSIIFRK